MRGEEGDLWWVGGLEGKGGEVEGRGGKREDVWWARWIEVKRGKVERLGLRGLLVFTFCSSKYCLYDESMISAGSPYPCSIYLRALAPQKGV